MAKDKSPDTAGCWVPVSGTEKGAMGWWHQKQEKGALVNMLIVDIAAYGQGCSGAVVLGCCCHWWHNLQAAEASLPGASSGPL